MNKWTLRSAAILFALFCMISFGVLNSTFDAIEDSIYTSLIGNMSPMLTSIMLTVTGIGNTVTVVSICVLLMLIPKTRRTVALPVIFSVILSAPINLLLKFLFARERPNIFPLIVETGFSFPSGHAMNNAALYSALILALVHYAGNVRKMLVPVLFCGGLAITIGISRVYLGVHYAGDILCGWLLGVDIAIIMHHTCLKHISTRIIRNE